MPQTIENPLIQKEQTKQKCIFRFTLLRLVCAQYIRMHSQYRTEFYIYQIFFVPPTNSRFFVPLTIENRHDMQIADKQICIIIQN